jgi:cytoskeleton protein RodZ
VAPKAEPVPQAKPVAVAAPGQNTLTLRAKQNSWVELKAGNNVLLSRLLKAGETENVELAGAAFLVIGNASGVDVSLRGQPIDTKTDGKSNVARISLK